MTVDDAGLYEGLARAKSAPDTASELLEFVAASFKFWNAAWPHIEAVLRARRSDAAFDEQLRQVDESRYADILNITRRLKQEGRLQHQRSPRRAADIVFSLTQPSLYEDLVHRRKLGPKQALNEVSQLLRDAILQ